MARRQALRPPRRSPKAGRPPEEPVAPARVRRRRKTATAQLAKGSALLQVERRPRFALGAKKRARLKKR